MTHEPGGTPLAQAIREVFLDPKWGGIDGTVELLLVFASRRQHLIEKIEPELARGRARALRPLHRLDARLPGLRPRRRARRPSTGSTPSPPVAAAPTSRCSSTCRQRMPAAAGRRRRGVAPTLPTGSTSRALAFYERVRAGYLELAAAEPQRFRIIDSSGDLRRTEAQMLATLESIEP